MLKWLEYNDWKKAFLEVIPGRKIVLPAEEASSSPK